MALEILYQNNTVELKGELDATNVTKFRSYFKNIFDQFDVFTVNIGELKRVDVDGVTAFEELYKQSVLKSKRLYLTGYGSRDLYDHLRMVKVA